MIIYSVMPMEVIMNNMDDMEYHYSETEVDGVKMLVEHVPSSVEARIIRLLSPNPQDYLNPSYSPGQKIYFRPNTRLS